MGMRFDSKHDCSPPAILLGLLLCPWIWDFFFFFFFFLVGSNILLSMVVQLLVDFGVLAGEDEHMFLYSTILT